MPGVATTPDGYGVLVERLWPRGVPKTDAEIDDWARATTSRAFPLRARTGRLRLVYSAPDEERDVVVPLTCGDDEDRPL